LSRVAAVVYWFVVVDLLLVLTTAPGAVALVLLDRDVSNLPLIGLALLPVGPALAAAVFAWREFLRERDLSPGGHFWRGYRLSWRDALTLWVPAVAVLVVLGTNLLHAGLTAPVRVLHVVLVAAVLLVLLRATVLTALFAFRWRDRLRLAVYYLGARPVSTLALLSVVVLAVGLVAVVSDWVLLFTASLLTFVLARGEQTVVADVEERFVQGGPRAGS
jgi:uncharacterized membrane protein YesL